MKQAGISSLIAVLFGMAILSAIMLSLHTYTFILTRQSTRLNASETAYYAAESIIYETAFRIKQQAQWTSWPPNIPFEDKFKFGDSEVEQKVEYIPEGQYYQIDIQAELRGMKRHLIAQYKPGPGGYLNIQTALAN